jgi:hypothetical protein
MVSDLASRPDRFVSEGVTELLRRVIRHLDLLYRAFTNMQDALTRVSVNYQGTHERDADNRQTRKGGEERTRARDRGRRSPT